MDIVWWVIAHPETALAILGAIHTAAVVVVNLTPTPADNAALARAYKVIEALAGVVTSAAKELPGERALNKQVRK